MEMHEVMIGNVVMYKDEVITIRLYDLVIMKKSQAERGNYQPILLNETWCERLGFATTPIDDDVVLVDSDNSKMTMIEQDGVYEVTNEHIKIKYVHQLQNIAYMITGKRVGLIKEYFETLTRTMSWKKFNKY